MRWLLAAGALGWVSAASAGPLDQPPLTAAPAELLALAKAVPDAAVLFDHEDISFDAQGRATRHQHRVTVATGDDDDDNTPTYSWMPALQDRPVVRIRIIDPTGKATLLDASKLIEHSSSVLEPQLGSLTPGTVIEEDAVITDRAPRPAGRLITRHIYGGERTVIELSAPVRQAHVVVRGLTKGNKPSHQVVGDRERWRYEIGPGSGDNILIGITTAASWAAVAKGYRAVVDAALADPVALPAELPRTPTRETMAAIAAWVFGKVKPSSDDELVAPTPPAATLARGTGTATDKAVLLVSLLRQAKLRAELVATAGYATVEPDLPGLEAFHVVLVRVTIGGRELWIDPEDALVRPGTLKASRSRRRALVIAADTRGLIETPALRLEDNAFREVRTFAVAEVGDAQVTEVSHTTGAAEADLRRWAQFQPDAIRGVLTEYVTREYEGRYRSHTTSVADLDAPVTQTIEASDVRTVRTERDRIEIELYPRSTLSHLPPQVRMTGAPSELDWPMPHSSEIEHRIVVPPGFTMPALAPDRVRSIGAARFAEHQAIDGQTLIVTFRFETGKPHLTAAELATLRDELGRLEAETVHLRLPLTAAALAEAGKLREALAELDRLVRLHPKEALHHQQLATVLLRVGAGEAARREARRAVALEPKQADAYVTLGWVLQSDTLGRPYGFDWDRAGAIAALRQARALDPKHLGAAVHLADALVRNAHGRYGEPGAELAAALEAQRGALELDPADSRRIDVVRVLARLGRFAEAQPLVDATAEGTEHRDPWRVAIAAAVSGPAAGIRIADGLADRALRIATLDTAAQVLMLLGRYDAARGLATASGTPATLELARAIAHPAVPATTKDPKVAATDAMITCTDVDRASRGFLNAWVERAFRASCEQQSKISRDDTTGALLADTMQTAVPLTVEGDGDAWRVEGKHGTNTFALYVALDRGVALVLGDNAVPGGAGIQLDRLIARGKDDAARRLADWLAKDATASTGALLRRMWTAKQPRDREALQRVAGLVMADADPARALALLGGCTGITGDAELVCHQVAIGVAYTSQRWPDVLAQDAWFASHGPPGALDVTWGWASEALAGLGRFDEAERRIDDTLARRPDLPLAVERRISVTVRHGNVDEALRRADALVGGPDPTAHDLNQIAWLRLVEHRGLDAALALATRAVRASPREPAYGNTLAAVQAELGDPGAALPTLLGAIPAGHAPRNDDWYVLGRIYEQLGRTDEALAAYRRVTVDRLAWGSCYELAARRLTAMHASH